MPSPIHLDRRRLIVALAGVTVLARAARADAPVPAGDLDALDAGAVAVALSELEIAGDYNALYGALHPDSRALVSKAAIAGWYEAEFAPRNPGPISQIVSVETVDWTWDVTGETYPSAAEVTYTQPFDGVDEEVVVRLVRSDGFFAWFFGRDRAFVEEQESRYGDGDIPATTDLTPEELVDAIAGLDRDAVEPYITADGLTLNGVEIIVPDQEREGGAGPVPLSFMRATIGYIGSGPSTPSAGTVTLTVGGYANEGLAAMQYNRYVPIDTDTGDLAVERVTLASGQTARVAYAEPSVYDDGQTHVVAEAQRDSVTIQASYAGSDGDGIAAATVGAAANGLDILDALLAGEV